jgi:hypothetical protein
VNALTVFWQNQIERSASSDDPSSPAVLPGQVGRNGRPHGRNGHLLDRCPAGRRQSLLAIALVAGAAGSQIAKVAVRGRRCFGLLSLFTHIHLFWIAGLLLALIDLPDFGTPLQSIAGSVERIADSAQPDTVEAERDGRHARGGR